MKPSRNFLAATMILGCDHFDRPEVDDHIHTDWVDFDAILTGWPWSPGELVALNAALAVYNGGGDALLSDVLSKLDTELLSVVLMACRMVSGLTDTVGEVA